MTEVGDRRGILYPTKLPTFHREPAPECLSAQIRWFWIPQWDLAPGRTLRQDVLPFPASNLVVGPNGVTLAGPTVGASHRDLTGRGWAVGALLRPAGIAGLAEEPRALRDLEVEFPAPTLQRAVTAAIADPESGPRDAARAFGLWAEDNLAPPDDGGLLANAMEDLIASNRRIVRVEQVADHLGLSIRGTQRLARRYIGLPPLAVIRRYRLQEAAQRLIEDPHLTVAQVAADLGYADHAHLDMDFKQVLGATPTAYRRHRDHSDHSDPEGGRQDP